VVYVTHDQTEAMTLSTKVALLNNGFLQQLDTPEGIYSNPANQFVAGFIGSPQMNFLRVPCDGKSAIVGNIRIPLPPGVTAPKEVVLGIRPEHVHLANSENEPTIHGQVFLVENLGMHNLVSVQVDGVQEPMKVRALMKMGDGVSSGSSVKLAFLIASIHWFDATTGDRLSGAPAKAMVES
jgi:multiple sugar transport system ATP-binding protein